MIETIFSSRLPVDECLRIRKNRISSGSSAKRLCVITGTHGDELEGQYVAFQLAELFQRRPDDLDGTVDIYPALNPLGIDSITRGIPNFDLDMNRIFPGDAKGSVAEIAAHHVVEDIRGADMAVDIHSSNIFLREVPQARINVNCADALIPYAQRLNLDFIWIHAAATVLEATLAHSLNTAGTPTLVVEMGVGMRINRGYCNRLVDGILNLMASLGMWKGKSLYNETHPPARLSSDGDVIFINAKASGLFVHTIEHSMNVRKGQQIGRILDPLSGRVLHDVRAENDGYVFTLRAYPIVYEGSLIARIYQEK